MDKSPIEIAIGQTNILIEDEVCKAVGRVGIHINKEELLKALKAYEFVEELTNYIFAYPDDDYMTMECLCRKLHKYGLIDKKDGEWTTDFIDRKTENSSEIPNNSTISKMEQVDKPQTDCGDFADRLAYERGVKHAWEVAQKVFDSTVTFYEAEDVAKQIDKDINVRSKDEQTDCTEALTLLWIKNMVTDEEFYRIDARLKVMPQTERSE